MAIGTGFKILDRYQPATDFQYRKYAQYWGGDPFIERWHQPIIPEYSNRYAQFVAGNILDFTPTARDVLLLHNDAPQTVIVAEPIPDNSATRMRFGRENPAAQPWADPRVRVAVRRSIDFKTIGEFLSNKAEFERNGIPVELTPMTHLPQNPSFWLNPENGDLGKVSENYLYNVAEAKKLTAAAGFGGPIPMNYYVAAFSQSGISDAEVLVMDSLQAAGTFDLQVFRVATMTEHDRYRLEGRYDGLIPQSGSSDDADYFVMLDYHSEGRVGTRGLQHQAYPDPRLDALGEAQRKELDLEGRSSILKDFQLLAAELMPAVPGRHLATTFSFRWPWLHNINYGTSGTPPAGQPVLGGHLHWLDPEMPNRDKG